MAGEPSTEALGADAAATETTRPASGHISRCECAILRKGFVRKLRRGTWIFRGYRAPARAGCGSWR